jgi:hypothetical protein
MKLKKYSKLKKRTVQRKMEGIIRIPNIRDYIAEIVDDELILTPRKRYITEQEFTSLSLTNSTILESTIKQADTIITKKKKYRAILTDMWQLLPAQKLLQNTLYNFKLTNEQGLNGYYWCSAINMSVQDKDANAAMKELIKMVRLNRYTMDISIRLEEGQVIHFKID